MFNLTTDGFSLKGSSHAICEDYSMKNGNTIVISDGCSTSGYKTEKGSFLHYPTDFGARILCISALLSVHTLRGDLNQPKHRDLGYTIISRAEASARIIGLPFGSLDATLLIATIINDKVHFYVYGDGYIVLKYADHTNILEYKYSKNAPLYLTYYMDPRREKSLIEENQVDLTVISTKLVDGEIVSNKEDVWKYNNSSKEFILNFSHDLNDLKQVILLSDGVNTFIDKSAAGPPKPILNVDVIKELIYFPSEEGECVTRNMRFFEKDWIKRKLSHHDDLTMAGISIKNSSEV